MMPAKGKRKRVTCDVLSNLPENVIDDILMCLHLRDAVRTSILSSKWRYNWCRLPQLKLDPTLWDQTGDFRSFTIKLTNIIDHLLTLHVGPIFKFILSIFALGDCPKIDNLIYFLSRNEIQHLVLQLPYSDYYRLPSSFFACMQLRHLTLETCLIYPSPVFKGFDRLISLELCDVSISSEFLGSLIFHCPLLEHLVLKKSYISSLVEINAPKLRSFVFVGSIHILCLKNVPLLAKVSVQFTHSTMNGGIHDLAKYFESIPALKNLDWKFHRFRHLTAGAGEVPRRLPSALNCLKRLYLNDTPLDVLVELAGVLCLIRSSPYLEDFEIEVYRRYPDSDMFLDPAARHYVDEILASFSNVTLNHLRAAKLIGVAGIRSEMQLIKLLLTKSPALVRMVIGLYKVEDKNYPKVLEEITKFQRASSKAEVIVSSIDPSYIMDVKKV